MLFPLSELPDEVAVETEQTTTTRPGAPRVAAADGALKLARTEQGLTIDLVDAHEPLKRIVLYWRFDVPRGLLYLGDAWERSYGELEWAALRAERVMPWYFAATDRNRLHAYGVRTNAKCFAFWQVHDAGILLNLDLRSGTEGVQLAGRPIRLAELHLREAQEGEGLLDSLAAFCRELSTGARLAEDPVYGMNDWYCHYAKNSRDSVIAEASLLGELSEGIANRPYMIIDAGWSVLGGTLSGPWDRANDRFPRFEHMADDLRSLDLKPGIWTRPLTTRERVPDEWVLRTNREGSPVLDPTIDGVREKVRSDIRRLVTEWGFELVKHDFTSFDIFDLWGNEMGREVAQGNWRFAHAGLTNAEVVRRLYEDIREAADDAVIIGCNTVGHLSVGLFELQRIGDDTSGRAWERTRRMGVNTLAFRAAQHNAFFAADADCVGMTSRIPWELNEQWLDLVSRSGTPLFVSPCVSEVTGPRRSVLREAFERASRPRPVGEPLDWLDNSTPTDWRFADGEAHYRWNDGAAAEFRLRPKE